LTRERLLVELVVAVLFFLGLLIGLAIGMTYTSYASTNANSSKACYDAIMWGDNSSVGLPENITEYCSQ